MTMAQFNLALSLFWVLLVASLLYLKPWRKDFRAGSGPGDLFALRTLEILLSIFFLLFVLVFVLAVLFATVWALPQGQQPAPDWGYIVLASDVAIIVALSWFAVRRRLHN